MFTQFLSTERFNALDPEKVCVAHDSGDGDLYAQSGTDLLEAAPPGATLSEAFDRLLNDMRRDSFEIFMVNRNNQIVIVQFQEDAPPDPPLEFRLLTTQDIISPDDEFLTDDCMRWARVGDEALRFMIGKHYNPSFFQPMRRKDYPRPKACPESSPQPPAQ